MPKTILPVVASSKIGSSAWAVTPQALTSALPTATLQINR